MISICIQYAHSKRVLWLVLIPMIFRWFMPYFMEFLNYCVVESYLLIVCLSNLGLFEKGQERVVCSCNIRLLAS